MHRSYREHKPTQVIRYDNRIEIINPGFSLKSEDRLGQPGSETRNPFIAAVFHDTILAETKGSGIRAMRRMMTDAHRKELRYLYPEMIKHPDQAYQTTKVNQ